MPAQGQAAGPVQGADQAGPPRSKRRVVVGVALVGVAALVAGILVSVLGSGPNADAVVINAVTSAIGDKTAHVDVTSSSQVDGQRVTFTGTGAIDFTQNALQMTLTGNAAGQALTIQAIYVGETVYESVPEIAQVVPGKSWLSIDLSSLTQATGQSATASELGGDPIASLKLLTVQGNTVTALGPSTVDGQAVQGYSVTFNPSAVQSELTNANLPAWLKQAVSQVQIGSDLEKLYVDGTGDLVRFSQSVTEKVGSVGSLTEDESLDFSDFGAAVSITAPPADQVVPFSQFLQSAGNPTTN
jgi:hypothetical protein